MSSKRYGRAWKRIRDKYVQEHPYCEVCGSETEEVHHIVPICQGGKHTKDNLIAVCSACHLLIHIYYKVCDEKGSYYADTNKTRKERL